MRLLVAGVAACLALGCGIAWLRNDGPMNCTPASCPVGEGYHCRGGSCVPEYISAPRDAGSE